MAWVHHGFEVDMLRFGITNFPRDLKAVNLIMNSVYKQITCKRYS